MKELFLNFLNMSITAGCTVLALVIGGIRMEELFLSFLNMSITAGWIVLALVILRPLFKKAPKWITCALWGLVALRLIFPFSIESAMSLIPSAKTVPPETIYQQEPQISTGIPVLNSAVNPILSEQFSAQGYETETVLGAKVYPFEALVRVCAFIWLIGMGAMLLYMLLSFLILKIRLREAVKSEEGYYHSDKVPSPFIFGIVNPRIYLPAELSSEDKRHVLAHERAHLKRKDHLIKPFGFFLLCFYWFNPLLWLAYILLCRDIEAACDEKVIKNMDAEGKKGYSTALLHCSIGTNARRTLSACPLAFGETGVKGRIKSVLSYKKPALWVLVGAVVLSLVLTGCLLTDPKGESLEVDDEIQRALSKIILEENHNDKRGNTQAFEGHTVFGSEDKNGDYTYYLWINYGEYTLENGRLEHYNGFSGPAKITMELHDEEGFVLKEYKTPRDGSYYDDDIRKMVPMKWWSKALNGQNYAAKNKEAMWKQIEPWLLAEGTYNYTFSDYDRSYLSLKEDGTFSLILSTHGAYYPYGSYVTDEKNGLIVCTTEDLGEKYVFKKDTNTLIFVKEDSAALPEYSYNGKVRPCIPDGAIFTEPGFIPESDFVFPQVDGIAFDIDSDGEKERFSLTHGPTSGVISYYLTMLKGEEQTRVLLSPCARIYSFDIQNERLYLKGIGETNEHESYLYEILLENGVLLVKSSETHSLLTASHFAWDRTNEPALTLPEYEEVPFVLSGRERISNWSAPIRRDKRKRLQIGSLPEEVFLQRPSLPI
ncbi:MAG: hypothetical protein IJZ37_04195 [Clostridia bacterium]|nr:hypothetical protein [Clostridia bacterium]